MRVHTNSQFEQELQEIKDTLLAMGGRCEQMMEQAVRALEERDHALAKHVRRRDRSNNEDERIVDDLATRVLALRNPVGRDLRFIVTAVKVVTDLERIGDEAVNLAERVEEMTGAGDVPPPADELPQMVRLANAMLRDSLDAFLNENVAKAMQVMEDDDAVDEIYGRTLDQCERFMSDEPMRTRAGMRVCSCAKYVERIADHATNIAEMVVYLVRGQDVRHRPPELRQA